jgi:hypothetical protein
MPNSSPSPARADRNKEKPDGVRTGTKAQTNRPSGARPPTHEQIAARAYELYERDGRQEGRELEYWLQAEFELGSSSTH